MTARTPVVPVMTLALAGCIARASFPAPLPPLPSAAVRVANRHGSTVSVTVSTGGETRRLDVERNSLAVVAFAVDRGP